MNKLKNAIANRYRNPYFWFGLVAVIISASGIDPESLTEWSLVGTAFLSIVSNPVKLVAVVVAITGVFVNPTSKGLKD